MMIELIITIILAYIGVCISHHCKDYDEED